MNPFGHGSALIPALVFAVLPACSSGGGGGGTIGDGGVPRAASPGSGASSSTPPGATSVTCSRGDDCGNWACQCKTGAPVNAKNCTNGYCIDAEHTCPSSCRNFGSEWTGSASGGPTPSPSPTTPPTTNDPGNTSAAGGCTAHADCDPVLCRCTSGFTVSEYEAQSCDPVKHACKSASRACPDVCKLYGLQWVP